VCGCYIRYCFKSSAADGKADGSWSKRGDMTNELTRSAAGERAHLLVLLYILGEGEDVVVFLPVVRRGFAAISKVPPVMPAEAKSKGGGIWKFGCKGGVDVVVALVVIALVIFVATTVSAVVCCPCAVFFCRCSFALCRFSSSSCATT